MGRKNKLGSLTNKVRPGTLWICINTDIIVIDNRLSNIQQGDFIIVISIEKTVYPDDFVVNAYSQKMNRYFSTPLEYFYTNYRKT